MTLAVSIDLRKTTRGLFGSTFVCASTGLAVQRIAIWAKELQILWPIMTVDSICVVQNRLEGPPIPNEWFGVKATLMVVASLGKRRVLVLSPMIVVPSDSFALPSLATSVTKHVIASQS